MVFQKLRIYLGRAKYWYDQEGILTLSRRAIDFLVERISPIHYFVSFLMEKLYTISGRSSLKKDADSTLVYGNEITVTVDPPDYHVDEIPDRLSRNTGEYHRDAPTVYTVKDVDLIGSVGVPVFGNFIIPLEVFGAGRHKLELYLKSHLDTFKSLLKFRFIRGSGSWGEMGAALSLATVKTRSQEYGFFNWMQWAIPMMVGLKETNISEEKTHKLIVRADPPGWAREYLELLGYTEQDLVKWEGNRTRVEKLYIPTVPTGEYAPSSPSPPTFQDDHLKLMHPQVCNLIRDELVSAAKERSSESETAKYADRVYISRQSATEGRSVVNFDELEEFLERHDFEVCQLEQMTVEEQIMTMAEAKIVLAPHGAGIANIMFCDRTTLLELLGTKKRKATFFVMAKALDHDYGFLLCDNDGEDIIVDVDKLERLFGSIETTA